MPALYAFYSKMLAERTASRNVLWIVLFLLTQTQLSLNRNTLLDTIATTRTSWSMTLECDSHSTWHTSKSSPIGGAQAKDEVGPTASWKWPAD